MTPHFENSIGGPLLKKEIDTVQINLGKICNLACSHCHVDAGPHRTETLSQSVLDDLLQMIETFPQIKTVDLTGGAPEMNFGFRELVTAARKKEREVLVRSNLTILCHKKYEEMPDFFAEYGVRVVASLPCYLADNVDNMRGKGVFSDSITALKKLNAKNIFPDLVYNPPVPSSKERMHLPPPQKELEKDYKKFLHTHFDVHFGKLLTITNLPVGRFRAFLKRKNILKDYIDFLAKNFNPKTVGGLMCLTQLSVDYEGKVFDCDFHQMNNLPSRFHDGTVVTVREMLKRKSLKNFQTIPLREYCFGCTAGAGSSCGGAVV